MANHDDVYDGPSARTRVAQTTVWCGGCQAFFAGRYQHAVDADADAGIIRQVLSGGFGSLNRVRCPKCKWSYVIEAPLYVHRPAQREFLLVVPEQARHRALQVKAEFLREVADAPGSGVLPRYVTEPILVGGLSGLAEHIDAPRRSRSSGPRSSRSRSPPMSRCRSRSSPSGRRRRRRPR